MVSRLRGGTQCVLVHSLYGRYWSAGSPCVLLCSVRGSMASAANGSARQVDAPPKMKPSRPSLGFNDEAKRCVSRLFQDGNCIQGGPALYFYIGSPLTAFGVSVINYSCVGPEGCCVLALCELYLIVLVSFPLPSEVRSSAALCVGPSIPDGPITYLNRYELRMLVTCPVSGVAVFLGEAGHVCYSPPCFVFLLPGVTIQEQYILPTICNAFVGFSGLISS